jgi:hypothetical protein
VAGEDLVGLAHVVHGQVVERLELEHRIERSEREPALGGRACRAPGRTAGLELAAEVLRTLS